MRFKKSQNRGEFSQPGIRAPSFFCLPLGPAELLDTAALLLPILTAFPWISGKIQGPAGTGPIVKEQIWESSKVQEFKLISSDGFGSLNGSA